MATNKQRDDDFGIFMLKRNPELAKKLDKEKAEAKAKASENRKTSVKVKK